MSNPQHDSWAQRFDDLVQRIQQRMPAGVTPQEIEADITAARDEVRQARRERRVEPSEAESRPPAFSKRAAQAAQQAGGPEPTEEAIVDEAKGTREQLCRERYGAG